MAFWGEKTDDPGWSGRRQPSSTGSACRSMRGISDDLLVVVGEVRGMVYSQLRGKVFLRQSSLAPACCWKDAAKYQLLNQNSKVCTLLHGNVNGM
jgi:hypothetical protein